MEQDIKTRLLELRHKCWSVRRVNIKYWTEKDERMMKELENGLEQTMQLLTDEDDYVDWLTFVEQVQTAIEQLATLYVEEKDGNEMMSMMRTVFI
jgi:hypothetical protein